MKPGFHARPTLQLHRLGIGPALPPTAEMLALLDLTERRRADRYATPARAEAFVAGRYLLRTFAADLMDTDPRALVADFGCPVCRRQTAHSDHGRPGYLLDGERLPFALSLSRTADAVLLGALDLEAPDLRAPRGAGSLVRGIGVDIDAVSGVVFDDFDDVALSQAERDRVTGLPRNERDSERARLWVRKEALVKAEGTGFSPAGPADVDVLADPRITDLVECNRVGLAGLGLVAAVAVV